MSARISEGTASSQRICAEVPELKRLASEATPGPWASHLVNGVPSVISLDGFYVAGMVGRPGPNASRESNAAYISAAHPAAVLELLAQRDELRTALQRLMPSGVCLTNKNIPDELSIPCDISMGDLRAARAAIERATP